MPVTFTADEEEAAESGIDFTPDPAPAVAPAPRPIIPPQLSQEERLARRAVLASEMQKEAVRGQLAEATANRFGIMEEVVRPFASTAENPLGGVGSALSGAGQIVAPVTAAAGNVAVGLASDIGGGGIQRGSFPLTSRALSGAEVGNVDENTALLPRIAEGAVRGAGQMVPALAATAVGVPSNVAFGGQMGLTEYGTSGDVGKALTQAVVGGTLGKVSEVGTAGGGLLASRVAAKLPAAAETPIVVAGEFAGRQALQNTLTTAGMLPELVKAYQEDPAKGADMLAESIGVNLAFEAAELPKALRESIAKDHAQAWLKDPQYLSKVDAETTRQAQPQRAQAMLPETMKEVAKEPAMPKAAEPVPETINKSPDPAKANPAEEPSRLPERFRDRPVAEIADLVKEVTSEEIAQHGGGATGFMWDVGAKAKTAEDVAALRKIAEDASVETRALMDSGDLAGAMKVIGRQPAEAYEFATGVKLDGTPKWDNFEKQAARKGQTYRPSVPDAQYVKAKGESTIAASPDAVSKQKVFSPINPESFSTRDAGGNLVLDIPKLTEEVRSGKLTGGPASNAILLHLLEKSDLHPTSPVKLIDLSPQELQQIGSMSPAGSVAKEASSSAYRGLFYTEKGSNVGNTEILLKNRDGAPVSQIDFVTVLTHELVHNNVTSKLKTAPAEVRQSAQDLFRFFMEKSSGTDFENHNANLNVDEFFAEALSNPNLQRFLTKLDYSGRSNAGATEVRNSAFGKFLEIVKRLLKMPDFITTSSGRKVDIITALDEAVNISKILENIQREAAPANQEAASPSRPDSPETGKKAEPDEPAAPRGIAASVREPGALGGDEAGAVSLAPLQSLVRSAAPSLKAAVEAVKDISSGAKETGKEALGTPRMTDYRRSVLNWSAKLQRSFDEAATFQKDIQTKVPDAVRREGITNWIQADGDAAVLRQRAAASSDPKLKAGYEAALKLTPEEIAVADQVRGVYERMGKRGQAADVLNSHKDNYVTQIWDLGKTKAPAGGSSRTLKERFKFSKASTFPTFFDGEQAGYAPKTKDISKLLPVYTHEMNSVIAAREMVEQMSKGKASDGRPLVSPRGGAVPAPGGGATLVLPKKVKGDTSDYKVIGNQPALNGWRWASKDSAGNPIFLKGDLALHPEAVNRLKNVLGRSAIREWYTTPTTKAAAIPKAIVRGMDFANSETKKTMLGMLAPFHQVQTGTHAVGHRVNPFGNIPKVDLVGDVRQMDAAKHGLMMLPDRASEGQFMEGFNNSGLVSKIPGLGPLSDMYSNYLFKQYIPGLKFKTYEAILERNNSVYAADLSSGKMKPEDIKVLSAEQANAAYGHLNYADLGRNPTLQHMAQIGLLAPDFLEARGRFFGQAIKGATGAKVGREQLIALATLAVSQAAAAYISAKLSGGEWDKEHPFEFHVGSRKYTMRSVPEDVSGLISNTRSFIHSRLSPLVGKGALQYLSGVDYAGRKVTAGQTTKELLTQPIPMTARSLPGIRELSGQDRPGAIKAWEQLAGAVGLKISRYNTRSKLNELHADWVKNNPDPKVKADYEQQQTATFPVSKYKSLDSALADRDEAGAIRAIAELKAEGQKPRDILKRMRPFVGEGINSRAKPLFHGSHKLEAAFRNSLNPEQKAEYQKALAERKATYQEFLKAWRKRGSTAPTAAPKIDFVPDAGQ